MTAAQKLSLVSVDDYLHGELSSTTRHEYLGGVVYAMAGATNVHNTIASNWLVSVGGQLRGKPCQAFNADTKVRVRLPTQTRFYYPDGMIVCRPNPGDDTFQDQPVVLFEVLSESTRRTDEGEKKDAYLTIPSLSAYVLVETDRPRVVVYRRHDNGAFVAADAFTAEVYEGLAASIPFADVGCTLDLAELYARIDFIRHD